MSAPVVVNVSPAEFLIILDFVQLSIGNGKFARPEVKANINCIPAIFQTDV